MSTTSNRERLVGILKEAAGKAKGKDPKPDENGWVPAGTGSAGGWQPQADGPNWKPDTNAVDPDTWKSAEKKPERTANQRARIERRTKARQILFDLQQKKGSAEQGEVQMNPKLQAGVELVLEKAAAEESGVGLLAASLFHKAAAAGILDKRAAQECGLVEEVGGEGGTASSNKSDGMEEKNEDYGKGADFKLDDDPSGKGNETGKVQNVVAGKTETLETDKAKDLSLPKSASRVTSNARVMATMLRGLRG
jgi:hypothetical protein